MFIKGVYVEDWKYKERVERINSIDEFKAKVKEEQQKYGEQDFPWDMHTDEIIKKVIHSLEKYLSRGEIDHV